MVGEKAEGLIATPITGVLRKPAAAGDSGSARSARSDDHTPGGGRKLSFTPVGFEGGGSFGAATLNFLQQVQDTAGGMTPADLYHWSAPEWGEHWRQRIGAVLARGQAE
eukprot:SAG31_NODE_25310_length_463_cov_6.101648_1_plen_108_part_01